MRFPRQFLFQVRSRSFFASVIFLSLFVCWFILISAVIQAINPVLTCPSQTLPHHR